MWAYLNCKSVYSGIQYSSKTIKQNTTKNKFIRYLCFIAVDFIHTCHHRLKMSSFSLEKNRFRSIDLTCWRSTQPLRLLFLTALNTSSDRLFGPRMAAVILKILHPFKYPEHLFRSDEKFTHQLPAMFTCRDGKGGKLSSRASKMLYIPLDQSDLLETLCSALKLY